MVKRKGKFKELLLALPILLVLMCGAAIAEVSVYAEGAYAGSELKVYVYADSNVNLVSFGVKLTYDPAELTLDESSCLKRNDAVWYFGTTDAPYDTPNAGPNVDSTEGSVVFVGGKIDSTDPQAGVTADDRILLGIVTFTSYDGTDITEAPAIGVELAKEDPYANFVDISGDVLDSGIGVTTIEIFERGNANGDESIDFQDMLAIKYYTQNGGDYHCYSDCNDDGVLDFQDMLCIRNKTIR